MRHAARLAFAFPVALLAAPALADIPDGTIKVGVLNDASGPFADQSGKGSVVAAQLAADDFAREAPGLKVQILYGDHGNKPDVGSAIVREWLDRDGVAAVTDAVNSGVALAINGVIADKHRTFLAANVGTSDLTGKFCKPTTVQWTFDTWAMGNAAARALTGVGARSVYFISFDYALGAALERDTAAAFKAMGGTVAGSVKHPLGTTDFSSYLLQAQGSGADAVAFADTGTALVDGVKQAAEFGVAPAQKLTGLFTQVTDVHAIGLPLAQGLLLTEAYYWDRDDASRAFAKRFAEKMPGRVPTENQAGVYSSVLAYLRAVKKADTIDGEAVVAEMKAKPIEDALFGTVTVRPDGRAVHAMYAYRVKAPGESTSEWDVYAPIATIPADGAFRPLADGGCPLVK
ncbi:ABC transporter substrate-binding protein [Lichenibacterium minor]|uniref:ABC transporter substrate-binding protein n=1 Tax=Lichenibacterium minor TaxID=2316528 RepID=A0A4Q2U9Z9_9HYPH|nr:ABC transporter substrate-binding protein [Lichenibacterium minor]RYC33332.1 ABC transporter substrate-binding protein [Lichenibacterium minor]